MNGQMTRHESYLQSLKNLCGPYKTSEIPNVKMNLRGLVKYAKSKNKQVPELSDEEINQFIIDSSMEEVRRIRIKVPGVEYRN